MLDAYKELTPVVYGKNAIKYLEFESLPGQTCFAMHWHERMEILHVCRGELLLCLGERQLTVPAGCAVIIVPCMLHGGTAGADGASYKTIMFDVEKFCNATLASEQYLVPLYQRNTRFLSQTSHPDILEAIDQLESLLTAREDGHTPHPLCAIGQIYGIIGLLYQHCHVADHRPRHTDGKFSSILSYINDHYTERISSRDISALFGYDETYFCRRFREVTGLPLMKYLRILRLELARKLLEDTPDTIGNISWKCGFQDMGYFSNCFKKQYGMSPAGYRTACQKKIHSPAGG